MAVACPAFDDGPDMVTIGNRVAEAAQHNRARARAKHRALGAVVKGVAMPVGGEHLTLFEDIATILWQLDGDAAGNGGVAFIGQQGLYRVMRGYQRGRTRRLQVHGRAFEIKDVAQPCGQEVLVIAGMAQKKHADIVDQIWV